MIKAILLDWGKTFSPGYKNVEKELDQLLAPCNLSWSDLYPCWKNFYYLRARGRIKNDKEMFSQIRQIMQKDIPAQEIKKTLIDSYLVPQENIDVISRLKSSYKIVLISNHIEEWLRESLEKYRLNKLFDYILISSAVGIKKPDAEIYFIALSSLALRPEETVFVSDELSDDLVSAKGCGIKTIWYLPDQDSPKKQREIEISKLFKPDVIIKDFSEIEKIVKELNS